MTERPNYVQCGRDECLFDWMLHIINWSGEPEEKMFPLTLSGWALATFVRSELQISIEVTKYFGRTKLLSLKAPVCVCGGQFGQAYNC